MLLQPSHALEYWQQIDISKNLNLFRESRPCINNLSTSLCDSKDGELSVLKGSLLANVLDYVCNKIHPSCFQVY